MRFHKPLALVMLSLVTSCVSHQTTAIIQTPLGRMPLVTTLPGPSTIHKVAIQGKSTRIEGFWEVNPDCTSREFGTIRVVDQPSHGNAVVYQGTDFPSFAAANPRSACNSRKIPGTFVKYTPAPGYAGDDSLSIEAVNADGMSRKIDFTITVE